jgi:AcrR family transcriptional regulator
MSRMTLHRRGVSKLDILRAVAEGYEEDHRQAMWTALVSDGTAQQRLRRALALQCEVTERNLATLEALSAAARDAIFHDSGAEALTRRTFVAPLQRLLLDGVADGSLAEVDAEETATVLFNAVSHTYRHLRTGHGWSAERARRAVIRLVVEGLIAR